MELDKPFLVISDLQIPFEHPKALPFCRYIKRHYRIPDANVCNVGDETDQYFGGQWKKDVNVAMTATGELTQSAERFRPWYDAFPLMLLCESNHGTRWQRKALEADIPETLMRRRQEVMGAPQGWRWRNRWVIRTKNPWLMEHGDRFGGTYPHVAAATANAMSTVIGHHHSRFGVEYIKTIGADDDCPDQAGVDIWGAVAGSLIHFREFAFNYARAARLKPRLGVVVVLNQGKIAFPIPMI